MNTASHKSPLGPGRTEATGTWDHDTIIASIAAAELMVASGETVDLIPLGERVTAYCEALCDSAPNDRDEARRQLGELVQRMDDLTNAVETRLDDVRRRLGWEASGRAAAAYGRGEPGQS